MEAQKIGLDDSLRVVAIGKVNYRRQQSQEAIVLRMLTSGQLSQCELGECVCNSTECFVGGLGPVVVSGGIEVQNRKWYFEAPSVELTRASTTVLFEGGRLMGSSTIGLDGHLILQVPFPGRILVATAIRGISGRWTSVSVNVTKAQLLGACLQYEVVQVLNPKEAWISISVIQGATCAATAHDMPREVVAALILLAMFFAGFAASVVSQIFLTRSGGRTLSRNSRSIEEIALDDSNITPLIENEE